MAMLALQPRVLGVPVETWAWFCLAIAALYFIVWPQPRPGQKRPAWRNFVLRWFHGVVWILMGTAGFMWARVLPGGPEMAARAALAALALYVAFIATFVADRLRRRDI